MRWIKIFESQQQAEATLPTGQPRAFTIENKMLCVVRSETRLFAVSNRCTHNGELLSKGHLNAYGEIVCPWHGYRFKLATGRECGERSRDLETFPVRVEDDGIYVGM
jgi:3-phenylpropionate/trans-cinnamate dioxygenase ferredoxin subunit